MNYLIPPQDIVYIVSDIIAGVFLTVLVISTITHHSVNRPGFTHLFAATILTLAGVFTRFFAHMLSLLPDENAWSPAVNIPLPRSEGLSLTMGFILVSIGIIESAVHTVYVNEHNYRSIYKPALILSGITIAAGVLMYACTGSIRSLTAAILAQLLCFNVYLRRSPYHRASSQFGRASLIPITTFSIALLFASVRLTGLGLSLMMIILNEQYHERIGQELAENEAALAKSRLQLLTEQISPHFIYNSLQSVRDLCGTDPVKARDAVDAFSEYLRGNLESLTREDLIPFAWELEHARAYLELEKIAGRRKFDVEYKLETDRFLLPPLVMQPLVENAVKYGAGSAAEGVIISIATHETEDGVCIEVTDRPERKRDNADVKESQEDIVSSAEASAGTAAEVQINAKSSLKRQSVGLENVRTRLAIQCNGSLDISRFGEGTKVTIRLPKPQTARFS